MEADVKGALTHLRKGHPVSFEHRGKLMTRRQALAVLEFADQSAISSTNEIPDNVIDDIIDKVNKGRL
jgi:TolB-like protein